MRRPPRPSSLASGAAAGLLATEPFQIAYATNDIEQAKALFQQQLGIRHFRELSGQLPSGGYIHVELAWVGNIMYELLTASGEGSELYMRGLPDDGFAIRHHHFGFLLRSTAEWEDLHQEIAARQWHMPSISHTPGFMRSCFVECPALGHYLEYLWPEPAGLTFFEQEVPAN